VIEQVDILVVLEKEQLFIFMIYGKCVAARYFKYKMNMIHQDLQCLHQLELILQ
jgi:hypothetical protein